MWRILVEIHRMLPPDNAMSTQGTSEKASDGRARLLLIDDDQKL